MAGGDVATILDSMNMSDTTLCSQAVPFGMLREASAARDRCLEAVRLKVQQPAESLRRFSRFPTLQEAIEPQFRDVTEHGSNKKKQQKKRSTKPALGLESKPRGLLGGEAQLPPPQAVVKRKPKSRAK